LHPSSLLLLEISDAEKQSNSHITRRKAEIDASREKFTSIVSNSLRAPHKNPDKHRAIVFTRALQRAPL
jgi:hypothetical protein